jgi:hypothetical protein
VGKGSTFTVTLPIIEDMPLMATVEFDDVA